MRSSARRAHRLIYRKPHLMFKTAIHDRLVELREVLLHGDALVHAKARAAAGTAHGKAHRADTVAHAVEQPRQSLWHVHALVDWSARQASRSARLGARLALSPQVVLVVLGRDARVRPGWCWWRPGPGGGGRGGAATPTPDVGQLEQRKLDGGGGLAIHVPGGEVARVVRNEEEEELRYEPDTGTRYSRERSYSCAQARAGDSEPAPTLTCNNIGQDRDDVKEEHARGPVRREGAAAHMRTTAVL